MAFYDRLTTVRETIKTRIETALGSDVERVVVGSKDYSHKLRFPMIWVVPLAGPIDDNRLAMGETWTLKFVILALLQSASARDPEDLRASAEELALRACGSLYIDPSSGKHDRRLGDVADDIVRTGFLPGDSRAIDSSEKVFGAGIEISILMSNREVA